MAIHHEARTQIPLDGLVLGYGPMLPFLAAAAGVWSMGPPWPALATRLATIWGAIILVFLAGVRRGYGFGDPKASKAKEIGAMIVYFSLGGLSLVLADAQAPAAALALLIVGFVGVAALDSRAASAGDAPPYFARLRGPQMAIAVFGLVVLLAHLVIPHA